MVTSEPPPDRQPCLFETLPETEPRRRRGRRSSKPPAAAPGPEAPAEANPAGPVPVPVPIKATPPAEPLRAEPVRLDAAALSNPELADLVTGLTDSSLGFLLIEVVHEVKRRLMPTELSEDDDDSTPRRPNPQLLRAVRTATLELTEGE